MSLSGISGMGAAHQYLHNADADDAKSEEKQEVQTKQQWPPTTHTGPALGSLSDEDNPTPAAPEAQKSKPKPKRSKGLAALDALEEVIARSTQGKSLDDARKLIAKARKQYLDGARDLEQWKMQINALWINDVVASVAQGTDSVELSVLHDHHELMNAFFAAYDQAIYCLEHEAVQNSKRIPWFISYRSNPFLNSIQGTKEPLSSTSTPYLQICSSFYRTIMGLERTNILSKNTTWGDRYKTSLSTNAPVELALINVELPWLQSEIAQGIEVAERSKILRVGHAIAQHRLFLKEAESSLFSLRDEDVRLFFQIVHDVYKMEEALCDRIMTHKHDKTGLKVDDIYEMLVSLGNRAAKKLTPLGVHPIEAFTKGHITKYTADKKELNLRKIVKNGYHGMFVRHIDDIISIKNHAVYKGFSFFTHVYNRLESLNSMILECDRTFKVTGLSEYSFTALELMSLYNSDLLQEANFRYMKDTDSAKLLRDAKNSLLRARGQLVSTILAMRQHAFTAHKQLRRLEAKEATSDEKSDG